jgi:hypothetical protein
MRPSMSSALTEQVLKAVLVLASSRHVRLFDSFNVPTSHAHFLCEHLGITEAVLRSEVTRLAQAGTLITPDGRAFRGPGTARFLPPDQRKEARLQDQFRTAVAVAMLDDALREDGSSDPMKPLRELATAPSSAEELLAARLKYLHRPRATVVPPVSRIATLRPNSSPSRIDLNRTGIVGGLIR